MFSLNMIAITRSAGRSAAGAVAYVTAGRGEDVYTGERFDYTRKAGALAVDVVGFKGTAEEFARHLDSRESRCNSQVAREVVLALPHQLSEEENRKLARSIALAIRDRWGVDSVVALHAPGRGGDQRNVHAHIVLSTRDQEGKKTFFLNDKRTSRVEVNWLRAEASKRIQSALRRARSPGGDWDHRSYKERGIDRVPTRHEGPMVTNMRRKGIRITRIKRALENDRIRRGRTTPAERVRKAREGLAELAERDRLERERRKLEREAQERESRGASRQGSRERVEREEDDDRSYGQRL